MARRLIIIWVSFFYFCCNSSRNEIKLKSPITHLYINDSTELIIDNPRVNKYLPLMYLYTRNRKDTLVIGSINARLECQPVNLAYTKSNNLITYNYFKFKDYFIFVIGNDEPYPSNTIFIFDIVQNKLLSPNNRILNKSDNVGFTKIFVTGSFARIDTTNCKLETLIRCNTKDVLYYSWDIATNILDSTLLKDRWNEISLDSTILLNNICDVANYKFKSKKK